MNLDDVSLIFLLLLFALVVISLIVTNWKGKDNGDFMYLSEFSTHQRVYSKVKPKSKDIYKLLKAHDKITLVIPDVVLSITPRFFEDLFKKSVLELGKDEFKKKVNIVTMGYPFERNLNAALNRIECKREYEFAL